MSQAYSDPRRAQDPYALPDVQVFQLTAFEAAQLDEDTIYEYMRRPEYRLANMNGRVRERMLDAIVEEQGITGGWFFWYCLPGCLPDSAPYGPYATEEDAIKAAQEEAGE